MEESRAMKVEDSALSKAFLEDHRHLTQGFAGLLRAIDDNDVKEARALADELDRRGGPHIEFEEKVFYPELATSFGGEFTRTLYQEHEVAYRAVESLLSRGDADRLSAQEQALLHRQVKTGLDHAITCGTLISHIAGLEPQRQHELLEKLLEFRRKGCRWSELSHGAARVEKGNSERPSP
jgi:hypothetical protein